MTPRARLSADAGAPTGTPTPGAGNEPGTGRGGWGRYVAFVVAVVAVVALDQVVKALARDGLSTTSYVTLIPGVLGLQLVRNVGAAFGILGGHVGAFVVLAALIVVACVVYLVRGPIRGPLMTASLALVCAGGIGNMVDRAALGYVTDMFRTLFVDFPVFNVADCAIVVGVVLFVIATFRGTK